MLHKHIQQNKHKHMLHVLHKHILLHVIILMYSCMGHKLATIWCHKHPIISRQSQGYNGTVKDALVHCHGNHFLNPEKWDSKSGCHGNVPYMIIVQLDSRPCALSLCTSRT